MRSLSLFLFLGLLTGTNFLACETDGIDSNELLADDCESGYEAISDGGQLQGTYNNCVEIVSGATINLDGVVKFNPGTELLIQPGVTFLASSDKLSYLIIDRGARISALGEATDPIVFTSDQPVGGRAQKDWGGIVINGFAPINVGLGQAIGEGVSGRYGGEVVEDSSGSITYTRIEFAGRDFAEDNELNGLALQGVGRGTVIDNVHLHNNSDDGIEMFGGTVNLKRIIATGNGDDQIDWTFGWTGKVQFAISVPMDGSGSGIEADSNEVDYFAEPQSTTQIYNLTYLRSDPGDKRGLRFRRGLQTTLVNAYMSGPGEDRCITSENPNTSVTLSHSIIEGCGPFGWEANGDGDSLTVEDSVVIETGSASLYDLSPFLDRETLAGSDLEGIFEPNSDSPLYDHFIDGATPPDDGFFEIEATYRGAMLDENWTDWTEYPAN